MVPCTKGSRCRHCAVQRISRFVLVSDTAFALCACVYVWGLSGGTGGALRFVEPVGLSLAQVRSILLIHQNSLSAVQSCGEWARGGHKLFALLRNTQKGKTFSCKKNQGCTGGELIRLSEENKVIFCVGVFAITRLSYWSGNSCIGERSSSLATLSLECLKTHLKIFLFSLITLYLPTTKFPSRKSNYFSSIRWHFPGRKMRQIEEKRQTLYLSRENITHLG